MKIYEILRPGGIGAAKELLYRAGYTELGHGRQATVMARPNDPFCVKLFPYYDTSYLAYLKLIMSRSNPHFPVVKGKPVRINDEYFAVRLERLEPVEGSNLQLHKYAKRYLLDFQHLSELEGEHYADTKRREAGLTITDQDRELLAQLGEIPDDWHEHTRHMDFSPDSKFTSAQIRAVRERLLSFEKYYPELAEALRLISLHVLRGEHPDLHDENVMQRGTQMVITDPSVSGTATDTQFQKGTDRQGELFQEPQRGWNDQLQQYDYAKLSHRLPKDLDPQWPASPNQRDLDLA